MTIYSITNCQWKDRNLPWNHRPLLAGHPTIVEMHVVLVTITSITFSGLYYYVCKQSINLNQGFITSMFLPQSPFFLTRSSSLLLCDVVDPPLTVVSFLYI